MPRWLAWDPDGRAFVVDSDSAIGAVRAACEGLSETAIDRGTTLRLQELDERAPCFDVGWKQPTYGRFFRLMINGEEQPDA